uniref:uncharacterized protein LOC113474160 n=1 Tax=Ciona intestinalis TaxID=7719 RepID=UPI000EF44B65|nr:uncharacterized protein LOC113474160 [Ciona intestinalis]|eukprot:XP_026689844.1 uncharacterized protein LOC113474160 [Ciona intestinalis]
MKILCLWALCCFAMICIHHFINNKMYKEEAIQRHTRSNNETKETNIPAPPKATGVNKPVQSNRGKKYRRLVYRKFYKYTNISFNYTNNLNEGNSTNTTTNNTEINTIMTTTTQLYDVTTETTTQEPEITTQILTKLLTTMGAAIQENVPTIKPRILRPSNNINNNVNVHRPQEEINPNLGGAENKEDIQEKQDSNEKNKEENIITEKEFISSLISAAQGGVVVTLILCISIFSILCAKGVITVGHGSSNVHPQVYSLSAMQARGAWAENMPKKVHNRGGNSTHNKIEKKRHKKKRTAVQHLNTGKISNFEISDEFASPKSAKKRKRKAKPEKPKSLLKILNHAAKQREEQRKLRYAATQSNQIKLFVGS